MDLRVLLLITIGFYVAVCKANDTFVDKNVEDSGNLVEGKKEENKIETFEELEGKMKKGINSIIRRLLPHFMKGAADSKVSGPCMSSLMRIIGGVRQLREWALRFLDATGKLPPGILEGTSLSLGDYDECLELKVGKKDNTPVLPEDVIFRGQYCLIESHRPESLAAAIKEYQDGNMDAPIAKTKTVLSMFVRYKHLSNTTFKFGVCIPSTCTKADLQSMLNSEALQIAGRLEAAYCEGDTQRDRTVDQYIILGIMGFIGGCLFLGTAVDIYSRIRNTDTSVKLPKESSTLLQMFQSFSLYSNTVDLIDASHTKEPLRVLCALRSLTVVLTIYSHTYGHIHDLHFQKFSKPANFLKFFDSFTFSGIANGSVGMDTVVFIAGVTITYRRWRNATPKGHVKLNIWSLLVQRYCRMSAAQLLAIGLFLLLPMFGTGPLWSAYIDSIVNNCRERWWLNLLYIGNFWSSKQTCLYHTWILAVIMQLTLISVLFLWILRWSPKGGICLAVALTLAGVIGVAVMTVVNDLPGSMAFFMLDIRTGVLTWRQVYTLAYDHLGPFCIGLLTGYYLGLKKDTLNLSRKMLALCWCISISCCSAVLFGLYQYRKGDKMGVSLSAFYAVTHRNVWALGIGWLVIACTTNNAGIVTKFLKAKAFIVMNRLCYMAFILHIPIMYYHSGTIRERWFMGHFELLFFAVGYIVLSFLGSFFLYISFVKPFYFIEAKIAACFVARRKEASAKRASLPTTSFTDNSSSPSEARGGCVNVGYSRTIDNL